MQGLLTVCVLMMVCAMLLGWFGAAERQIYVSKGEGEPTYWRTLTICFACGIPIVAGAVVVIAGFYE